MEGKTNFLDLIEKEFASAREARKQGIESRARVCARRCAGYAVAWLLASRGEQVSEHDSLNLLRSIQPDESIPPKIREASQRLTARVTSDFKYPFPTDPLDDALMIIDYVKGHLA
jgi:HEPN domain-containing protein